MNPDYSILTGPVEEPVSYDQAAEHLRVDSEDDQAYIRDLIPVAREYVETVTGRVCHASTWRLTAASWADLVGTGDRFRIYRTPVISVEALRYYAAGDGELTTLDAAAWRLHAAAVPAVVQMLDMPGLDFRPDAIQLDFVAGDGDAVSAMFRHAVKMMVAGLYENRMDVSYASAEKVGIQYRSILGNLKTGGFFG